MTTIEDFEKVDIRVGNIIEVEDFPEARKPAYKLKIDFGQEVGVKQSSARLVDLYTKDELLGKLVLGVVNFPPRQIGPFVSEVLTLGVPDSEHECILITPEKKELKKKSENISDWYNDVVLKAELADYAPVKGCMVIRPYGYALWENIKG